MGELKASLSSPGAIRASLGGGGGGVSDHAQLSGRDKPDQHPPEAVAGLVETLERIPDPMSADELRKILLSGGT